MLNNENIIAFLATADASSARKFYCGQLGFSAVYEDKFALVLDMHNTELRIQKLSKVIAQPFTVLGWLVRSIEDSVRDLTNSGVKFERFDRMKQDEYGIWQSPSGAKIAWFKDPDGNLLSLTQRKL